MAVKRRWRAADGNGLCLGLLVASLVLQVSPVCCIKVSAPEEIQAVRGDTVTLSCSFSSTSRPTSLLSVDWNFRPQSGGLAHTFFHFSMVAYPPDDGYFKGRVKWLGSPSAGDASIQLLNASLSDNGTYSCIVRNPPHDVHGLPSQTVLTVTPKKLSLRFSDVALLLLLILVPSGLTALMLLAQMLCPCCSPAQKSYSLSHHSAIEVTDGDDYGYKHPPAKQKTLTCYELYCLEPEEEYYLQDAKHHMEPLAESQC
ncbi:myelin protein zero-like protein 3 [Salminus brasiliensis]|uniref:myelin protein zero-like protein 3 n=1 Tax=Salminus brasiliensis TaxID=930266 RepID=UPI003B833831